MRDGNGASLYLCCPKAARVAAVLVVVLGAVRSGYGQTPSGPNVVLMVVDDMGWADWERRSDFYETPNLTRLANQGVEFTQAYASASVCSPTRASLLTGQSPALHKITKWIPGNPDNIQTHPSEPLTDLNLQSAQFTLGEAMQQGGYKTVHIGKWHLGQENNPAADPTNHGFETNIGGNHRGSPPSYTNATSYESLPGLDTDINENFLTDHLAQEAQNYIEDRAAAGERFFMNFDFYSVHTPIQSHPDYINYFQNKPGGDIHSNAKYASMLRAMDDAVGQILDTLDQQGIADETIVVFTSDHGGLTDETSNAPLRGGKGQQWEGGHRVPLIISGPGFQQAVSTNHQAISHDLYPTILEAAGVSGDAVHNTTVEGTSLVTVANGSNTQGRTGALFWHFPHQSNHDGGPYGAVVDGDYKFIENYLTGERLLFNVATNQSENDAGNLIDAEPSRALQMRVMLHDYLRDSEARLWGGFELIGGAEVLELRIDGDTGAAELVNDTAAPIAIIGYTILSESGSLAPSSWTSLSDQRTTGFEEANPSSFSLSELASNPQDAFVLGRGESISLGEVFLTEGNGGEADLQLEFVAMEISNPPGDFNNDATVDAADYTLWRNSVGDAAGALANRGPDSIGPVGAADYLTWREHFGQTATFAGPVLDAGLVSYTAPVTLELAATRAPETGSVCGCLISIGVGCALRSRP